MFSGYVLYVNEIKPWFPKWAWAINVSDKELVKSEFLGSKYKEIKVFVYFSWMQKCKCKFGDLTIFTMRTKNCIRINLPGYIK